MPNRLPQERGAVGVLPTGDQLLIGDEVALRVLREDVQALAQDPIPVGDGIWLVDNLR